MKHHMLLKMDCKIHEHDDNSSRAGLIYEGRLVCFYDFECDLGDGWEDEEVHNDSEEIRTKALKMGANTFLRPYGT